MRGWSWRIVAGLVIVAVGIAGCGKDPFGPPVRSRPTVADSSQEKAKAIYFIAPGVPTDEILEWGREAQTEANQNHVIFRLLGPKPDEASIDQSELIRRALVDEPSGLMVVPGDSPELGQTLAEAQSKGVAIALIGRSIPAPAGSKPFTVIDFAPFGPSADKIVGTVVEELKTAGFPVQGTVLVLADQATDRTSSTRVSALKVAASAAGFPKILELSINPSDVVGAKKAVLDATKANPDLILILADDADTMRIASQARQVMEGKPTLCLGGYIDFGPPKGSASFSSVSCYSQGRYNQLAILGVRAILSQLRGEPAAERVILEPIFHRIEPEDPRVPGAKAGAPIVAKPNTQSLPNLNPDVLKGQNLPGAPSKP